MQRFTPDQIPSKLPNLVYIEGPNSSGKSTLLNIIALGLFGNKSARINPALIQKMGSLLDSDYQKLEFSIRISSKDEDLFLVAEKTDLNKAEMTVRESTDGKTFKPLSFETFDRKYNLIYDIPSNPAERLPDLLKELKEEQLRYGNRFKEFGFHLRHVIDQIASSRDPKRLEEITKDLEQFNNERKEIRENVPRLRNFLESLEKHVYLKYYYYYSNECERLTQEKDKLERKTKRLGKNGKELSGRLTKFRNEISALQGDFSSKYNEVTPLIADALPKKEKARFKIWKEINPYCTEADELKTIEAESIHFLNLFGAELGVMESQSAFKDASMLQKIIQSLREFEDSPLIIPKIRLTIGELIRILREENDKNYVLISKYQTLTRIRGLLEALQHSANSMRQALLQFKETKTARTQLSDKYLETLLEEKSQLRKLGDDLADAERKKDSYLQKCASKNINRQHLENRPYLEIFQELPRSEELKPFLKLTEKQLEEKISELEQEIVYKEDRMKTLDVLIDQYQKERDRLEKQKPHKYEKHREELDDLLKKTMAISQRLLNEYNVNVKNLMEKRAKKEDIEKDERRKRYYEEVSRYLGHRMGFFRHIDKTYKARIVDLVSGTIITDEDITIHIDDMGTGQSQSAYILSLLNVRNDPRKIIALFDEIAMMDRHSLEPIYNKMRELYKAQKLLLGILVQKGDNIRIEALAK